MNSENKILQIVHSKGDKAPARWIAHEAGFGIDYTRYILGQLVKSGLLVASYGKDLFRVSAKGKKRLKPPRITKSRDKTPTRKNQLVTVSNARATEIKVELPMRQEESPKVVLVHNLDSGNEEKEFHAWSAIKKAAKYLSEVSREDKNLK